MEAPNCLPQMPSTPHWKPSEQYRKEGWPQTTFVTSTLLQPKYEVWQGLAGQAWAARTMLLLYGQSQSLRGGRACAGFSSEIRPEAWRLERGSTRPWQAEGEPGFLCAIVGALEGTGRSLSKR